MLIYGNTPKDIMKMMWRRRIKMLSIIVVIAVAVMLMGCTIGSKKVNPTSDGQLQNNSGDSQGIRGVGKTKSKDELVQ